MPAERVTVVIESSRGRDGPLTVEDGMHQILDFFALLSLAARGDGPIQWNLVSVTKRSPLRATAEAVPAAPNVIADVVARRAKSHVRCALVDLTGGRPPPPWMDEEARQKARTILRRNLNGIGKTSVRYYPRVKDEIIAPKARIALAALDQSTMPSPAANDLTHVEMGSVEGEMADATTWNGQPAIRIRERSSDAEIPCVLSAGLAMKVGDEHKLAEVWSGRRVLIVGEIFYKRDGTIARVNAQDVQNVDAPRLDWRDLANPDFTGGLPPDQYIASLWSDRGE